ncbi:hypothetical protein LguiA_003923 [Lonicera macranthoides]
MDTNQIEMMMMIEHMENLPIFSQPIDEFHFTQSINTNTTCSTPLPQIIINNPHLNSPTFINPQSQISFTHSSPVPNSASSITSTGEFLGNGNVLPGKRDSGEFEFHGNIFPRNSMAEMREMIFRVSSMQPIHIDPESVKPKKRRNVKISRDPQSVAARHRRERISERIRILQRIVPGGTKLDTASMLDVAIHYVKFLKGQVQLLEGAAVLRNRPAVVGFPVEMSSGNWFSMGRESSYQVVGQSVQQYLDV